MAAAATADLGLLQGCRSSTAVVAVVRHAVPKTAGLSS
jgi:hypothetical protein